MPRLPLDLYVAILEQVPGLRSESDSVLTLVNCLRANSLLRAAALVSALWEPHYRARYLHNDALKNSESRLKSRFQSNWRLMYAERRHWDRVALELLDQMVLQRKGRYQHAATLASMSFDIWDALEIECLLPVPTVFGGNITRSYAITRRYWAEGVLNMILRRFAIMHWGRLVHEDQKCITFVDAFSLLSAFFGKKPQEMHSHLLELGHACREYLVKQQCIFDPNVPEYDLPELCTQICQFMYQQGFGPVEPTQFYDILNHFPHAYLTTNKQTIPLSLVQVFVSIARQLGISASPVEFPGRVLVHVPSPPGVDDFLVDVFGADTQPVVSIRNDIPIMLMRHGFAPDNMSQYISPCGASAMLLRAARNIIASLRHNPSTPQSAVYVTACIHLLFTDETELVDHLLSLVPPLDPLYCSTFLADLQPLLIRPRSRFLLKKWCTDVLEAEEHEADLVRLRTAERVIKHYCGLTFEHRIYQYIGCIIGWDPVCSATKEWQAMMNVSSLPRGANQPFYHVLTLEGGQRYVAEDNISKPIKLTAELAMLFLDKIPVIGRYFSDAYIHPDSCRGRWTLSPELQQQYPDDELFSQIYDEWNVDTSM